MSRIRFKQVDEISRTTVSCAQSAFLKHCKLKNLSPYTTLYYEKNLDYFLESEPQIKYVDEIDQEVIEDYIGKMMERGNRVTAINTRLRAVFTFYIIALIRSIRKNFHFTGLRKTNQPPILRQG